MKTSIFKLMLATSVMLISQGMSAGGPNGKTSGSTRDCLKIKGIAMNDSRTIIDSVEVKLYKENEEMEWIEVTNVAHHVHDFNFTLQANSYYTIEVSRPGFVSRSIAVNTNIPDSIALDPLFQFEFEVDLFKETAATDEYYLDFPVAIVSYDAKHQIFQNHQAYTKNIKAKLKGCQ